VFTVYSILALHVLIAQQCLCVVMWLIYCQEMSMGEAIILALIVYTVIVLGLASILSGSF